MKSSLGLTMESFEEESGERKEEVEEGWGVVDW